MKNKLSNILLIIAFLAGVSLLLYPSVSDWWNSLHQSRAILNYSGQVAQLDNDQYQQVWDDAHAYNQSLLESDKRFYLTEEDTDEYNSKLNVIGSGIMGYLEIPKIKLSLPVYHSVEEYVLHNSIGHIPGSSLPVGGESTHALLSGHRGLPSARLFTDLDQMEIGDEFTLSILDEVLTYRVDKISIVEPNELNLLEIEPGKDLVTLITCTPYGVNTHRLLVRGHRVETEVAANYRITSDATIIDPLFVAPVIAAVMLLLLLIVLLIPEPRKSNKKEKGGRYS